MHDNPATQTQARDNFREKTAAASDSASARLAHQNRGRELDARESALADALMEIYGGGVAEPAAVVEALNEKNILHPSSGKAGWTEDSFRRELERLNKDFDAAYAEHGFGGT